VERRGTKLEALDRPRRSQWQSRERNLEGFQSRGERRPPGRLVQRGPRSDPGTEHITSSTAICAAFHRNSATPPPRSRQH